MNLSTSDLHALAALAEAATPDGTGRRIYAEQFQAAASPDVVLDLVARVLKSEAIARDLAAVDMGDLTPIRDGLAMLRELQRRAIEMHLPERPSPSSAPELRRWAVNLIKTRFAQWRSPPVETPADSLIDEVVGEILCRAVESKP